MRSTQHFTSFRPRLLVLSCLILSYVAAQGNDAPSNLPTLGSNTPLNPTTSKGASSATGSATSGSSESGKTTTAKGSSSTESSAPSSTESLPSLTSSSATSYDGITDAPTIGGQYPSPTVPPTADAPFMQKSSLPEGTIFICVGAVLGFFAACVLAWRGMVMWLLHRSVKRSANLHHSAYLPLGVGDKKSKSRRTSNTPFYDLGPESAMSLDQLGASGRAGQRNSSLPNSSLFFSPTAGAGMQTPTNRGSGYLPAGYYAAGNSAPGGGSGMTHLGGGGNGLSRNSLGPQSGGYQRAGSIGPSPPRSPSLPPSRHSEIPYGNRPVSHAGLTTQSNASNLTLNVPPQGRAPSAYLEDLFENYPPGHIPGQPPVDPRK